MIDILELQEAGEDGGGLMGYYCKGHVDFHKFARAANEYSGADPNYDVRHVRPEKVRHVWWRCVPIPGEDGFMRFDPAEPDKPGAFAVTVCESIQDRQIRITHNAVLEWRRGYMRGHAEGLNWALNYLNRAYPEAGEMLLKAWRADRDKIESNAP